MLGFNHVIFRGGIVTKIKGEANWAKLTKKINEAEANGMSYGQYQAFKLQKQQEEAAALAKAQRIAANKERYEKEGFPLNNLPWWERERILKIRSKKNECIEKNEAWAGENKS